MIKKELTLSLLVVVVTDDGNEDGHIKREPGGVIWSGGGAKETGSGKQINIA
jgi:hypothetical protein